MSSFEALGISVCAGMVVLILVCSTRILWSWFIENAYLKITCRHLTDISGEWTSQYTDMHGHACRDETTIRQYGYRIEGTQTYHIEYKEGKGERHKVFKFQGILRNDLFAAYYWNTDRKQKGSGTFTLQVSREGDVMSGKYSWFDVAADAIDAGDFEMRRSRQ